MIMPSPRLFLSGFLLDQIVGDPQGWPHPVIGMGKVISWAEKKLNCGTNRAKRRNGALLTLLLVGGSFILTASIIAGAAYLHPRLGVLAEVILMSLTLAGKSLPKAGSTILKPLQRGDLPEAREKIGWFVSRDTRNLSEAEVVRATVETLAENYVDGILSPLFYMAIGGAPLAMAFKAVSTLDSMIGYKNERYQDFGWFAARTDDWANYIPARLSVIFLLGAGGLMKLSVKQGYQIWKRDASAHPSPNGGNPESVTAGLLGIQLGGVNIYHGEVHHRAEMGDPLHPLTWRDILACGRLIRIATWLSFTVLLLALIAVNSF